MLKSTIISFGFGKHLGNKRNNLGGNVISRLNASAGSAASTSSLVLSHSEQRRYKSTIPSLSAPLSLNNHLSFGQPTYDSHPEFFRGSNEVKTQLIALFKVISLPFYLSLITDNSWCHKRRI